MSDAPIDDNDQDAVPTLPMDTSASRRASGSGFSPGAVVAGRYRIESYPAAGGMGHVYRAHDLALDVPLALKTIRPEIASNPSSLRRFKQEVLLARSVSHPNVCRIFDLGRDETSRVSFLTMEFLPGGTLASRIKTKGRLSPETSFPLVRQMADALDAAHRAGIVHRDFKSLNVMLVPTVNGDRAVITDFGLATTHDRRDTNGIAGSGDDAASDVTTETIAAAPRPPATHAIVGTPAYMSPEQVIGAPVGPASDLYALGVVLFEMCTGRVPFRGATPFETARAHVTTPPPRPSKLAAIDDAWERTILRLLSKEPTKRYATAHDAVLALEGHLNGKEAVRHSLPAERDAFVGRIKELDTLASHLEGSDGATRLLTLHGPGGTGKTRLAQKYGWDSLSRWPGGVWFCNLSDARSVDGIAQAVATALNVPLGKEDPVVQLGHAIVARGKSLVILDNFEQVVMHADATLGRWLERAAETRFLVTTRESLQLPGETIHELDPLDPTTHGVELFEVRAQGHRPGFQVDASNREQVEEIVKHLDGLPLAIELAASRLRVLSLEQLGDRLADRFKILAGGKRGRHATLEMTLDWSWELLQPWEQSAIAQASVFEGGFTLEAAEAVIDLSAHGEAPPVLDVIQALVDKSWLRTRVALEAPRFEMYATVQAYASAKLRAGNPKIDVDPPVGHALPTNAEARHGTYFAAMGTEDSITMLEHHGGVAKRAALHLELDNLVAACRRAIDRKREETAADAYVAAAEVLELRGPVAASIRLGLHVLGTLEAPSLRGRALFALSSAERLAGKTEEAREHYEAALVIHRDAGDRRSEGAVLGNLGLLHWEHGRIGEAREHYEATLSINREMGNRCSEGVVLGNLGALHREQGRMDEAREHYEAALAIHREVGNRRSEGVVLGNLGLLHREQGRMEEARERSAAALAIHREVGDRRSEGIVLGNLAALHRAQGRMEEARENYEAALAIHREVGNRRFEGALIGNLGLLHEGQGRMKEARKHYEAAIAIDREVGNRRSEGVVLGNLGNLHREQGRMEEAREHYEAALAIHREVGNWTGQGVVLGNLGDFHAERGHVEEARRCFDKSTAILRDVSDPVELGKVLCSLGELEVQQGNLSAARAALAEAESIAADLAVKPKSGLARTIEALRQSVANAKETF